MMNNQDVEVVSGEIECKSDDDLWYPNMPHRQPVGTIRESDGKRYCGWTHYYSKKRGGVKIRRESWIDPVKTQASRHRAAVKSHAKRSQLTRAGDLLTRCRATTGSARASDKKKNIQTGRLSPEYIARLWTGKCACCGITLNLCATRRDAGAPELDAVLPHFGHIEGNVQWVCRICNVRKQDHTVGTLLQTLAYIRRCSSHLNQDDTTLTKDPSDAQRRTA